jgi:predicted RNA-binding Zn ribbon-like protein
MTELHQDWVDGFLFIGNQLALDVLNTRPLMDGQFVEMLPDFEAVLRWFRAAGLLDGAETGRLERRWGKTAEARRTVEEIREFRERLRTEVLRWEDGGALSHAMVRELNRLQAEYPMRRRLASKTKAHAMESYFEQQEPEDLFAPLADAAARLFTETDRARLRKCRNCVLQFLDTSKKGTRQWCSMQLCGNRFKVAAYAARKRGGRW